MTEKTERVTHVMNGDALERRFGHLGRVVVRAQEIDGDARMTVENFEVGNAKLARHQMVDPADFDISRFAWRRYDGGQVLGPFLDRRFNYYTPIFRRVHRDVDAHRKICPASETAAQAEHLL